MTAVLSYIQDYRSFTDIEFVAQGSSPSHFLSINLPLRHVKRAPSTDRRQIPRTNRALHLSSRFGLGHYRDCGVSLEGTSAAHVNVLIMGEDEPSPVKILSSNRIVEDFDVKESDELIQASRMTRLFYAERRYLNGGMQWVVRLVSF